jgi:hypothetical protein
LLELGLREGAWLDVETNQSDVSPTVVEDQTSTYSPLVTGSVFAVIALIFVAFLGLHESVRLKR